MLAGGMLACKADVLYSTDKLMRVIVVRTGNNILYMNYLFLSLVSRFVPRPNCASTSVILLSMFSLLFRAST